MGIDVTREGAVATVTINQPDRLNALNSDRLRELLGAFRDIADDRSVRAIILTGAGERAFVAGADIREMRDFDVDAALAFARLGHATATSIELAPQPVIAVINGFALGGGCELALACDIRLASTTAAFAQPEVGLGIPPGWGGTQRLASIVGPGFAAEMIFSGRRVGADDALRVGLVNAVHTPGKLLPAARELASTIAANSPRAVRLSKRLIQQRGGGVDQGRLAEEARAFASVFGRAEQREGMAAFLDKRPPVFEDRDD